MTSMISLVTLFLAAVSTRYVFKTYRAYARNLAIAKSSGLVYISSPIDMVRRYWLVLQRFVIPFLRQLPATWTEDWLEISGSDSVWIHQYTYFKKYGTDTFLVVSPNRIVLWTADPSVICQMTSRRADFPKPLKTYKSLNIYGLNVVTTEGQRWKLHRKITSPPFSEKNNHLVWAESLRQAQAMMGYWIDGKKTSPTIHTVAKDTMRLSLYVISLAGFGKRLSWPNSQDERDSSLDSQTGEGHTLSYTNALSFLLENIIWLFLLRPQVIKNLPFQKTKQVYNAYIEWGRYLNEMLQAKKAEANSGIKMKNLDLMGALIGAGTEESPTASSLGEKEAEEGAIPKQALTDSEIMGNAFVFTLAGHESTANVIHYSLVLLAMHPSSQRRLQADLDAIFRGRPISEWDYERDLPKLFGGMCGAVLNEELRLIPVAPSIPKCTLETPQDIIINGKKHTISPHTYIGLIATAVHRNPNYWPHGPPTDPEHPVHPTSNTDNDLEEFKPERWFLEPQKSTAKHESLPRPAPTSTEPESALGINVAPDTSPALYRPIRGAYIPFSEGHRACLGRRFAQVEVLAVLAVILSQYSVELALDADGEDGERGVSDEELDAMSEVEVRELWERKKRGLWKLMRTRMATIITLQLRGCHVPLRFVKRGGERVRW